MGLQEGSEAVCVCPAGPGVSRTAFLLGLHLVSFFFCSEVKGISVFFLFLCALEGRVGKK